MIFLQILNVFLLIPLAKTYYDQNRNKVMDYGGYYGSETSTSRFQTERYNTNWRNYQRDEQYASDTSTRRFQTERYTSNWGYDYDHHSTTEQPFYDDQMLEDWFADAIVSVGDDDYGKQPADKKNAFTKFTDLLNTCPNIEPDRLSPLVDFTNGNGEKIEVGMQFVPKFLDISEVEESISLSGLLKLTWIVECEGGNLQGFRDINLGSRKVGGCCGFSDVWLPPIIHDNAKSNFAMIEGFDHDIVIKPFYNESGQVLLHFTWYRFGIFTAECPMEMAEFPFDSQTCSFQFAPKISHLGTVAFKPMDSVGSINMESTDSWNLIESKNSIVGLLGRTNRAKFQYTFKRRHKYFVRNILLPTLFLGFLGEIVAFALPADSADRPMFAVTILISLTYIHGIVQSIIPKTTQSVFINDFTLIHGMHSMSASIYFTVMCWFCNSFKKSMHNKMIRYKRMERNIGENVKELPALTTCYRVQWSSPFQTMDQPSAMKLYRFIDAIVFTISALTFLITSIWVLKTKY